MSVLRFPGARWSYATFVQALEEALAFFFEGDPPNQRSAGPLSRSAVVPDRTGTAARASVPLDRDREVPLRGPPRWYPRTPSCAIKTGERLIRGMPSPNEPPPRICAIGTGERLPHEVGRYRRLIALLNEDERPAQVRRFARVLDAMPEHERVSAEALTDARVHALSVRAGVSEAQVRELSDLLARAGAGVALDR